jgi:hypothetical protein
MLGIVSVSLAVIARVLPVVDVELRYADAVRVGVGPEAESAGTVNVMVLGGPQVPSQLPPVNISGC